MDGSPPPTWGFVGGLIKTFATKSESVIETYRRDLQEFSSGLKIETQVFKEVASSSLEVGASKAQESLESVGQAIDNIGSVVWKSTAQIIAQGSDSDLENPDSSPRSNPGLNLNPTDGRKYSRFDAQLRGIQCDVNTYVEEFEDVGEFEKWKSSFYLGEKSEEMGNLMRENGVMEGIYKRVVPNLVDHDLFWFSGEGEDRLPLSALIYFK
uniref:BSD domain-containing protein n=1 Tax=Chenopodium quinoa TaxID=63459 RepID=A0A803KPT1_CHEQI